MAKDQTQVIHRALTLIEASRALCGASASAIEKSKRLLEGTEEWRLPERKDQPAAPTRSRRSHFAL